MSWEDRDYASDAWRDLGRPGGDWQGMRPRLDNPFSWSLSLGRVSGILIRVHIIFLLFIIVELLRSVFTSQSNATTLEFWIGTIWIAGLFVMVLLHEFGHCLACRWCGGSADEILMWPLGGLAYCRPPDHWKAHLITVVGGPAVNVLFLCVMGPLLVLATGRVWGVAIVNPFDPFAGYSYVSHSWPLTILFVLNHANLILLLFNVLVPLFPLDGGRMVQAFLWARIGYHKSMRISLRVGYFGAIILGVIGMVASNGWLIGIAIFGGITCYITHKQLEMTQGIYGDEYGTESITDSFESEEKAVKRKPTRADRRRTRREEKQKAEAEDVDRILLKIASSGIESLTRRERRKLKQATEHKRHEG